MDPLSGHPTQNGFGMRLLSQALTQFEGVVETKFEATGLLCKMSIPFPENTSTIGPEGTPNGKEVISFR